MRLPRFIAATCLAVALPVAGFAMPAAAAQAPRIPDSAYSRSTAPWGPDVSGWNHPAGAAINWSRVRASGASFAFIKASEGTSYASPYFRSDANAARAQGMYAAGYHFARPRLPISTAVTEANYFAARLGDVRGAGWLPPVLDLEVTGGLNATNLTAWTRAFLETVEQRTGRTPAIYTGYWFWRGYLNNPTGFARYPLWYAAWNSGSSPGSMFGDWSRSTFWQYTDHASIPGIIGNADNNYFHGSRGRAGRPGERRCAAAVAVAGLPGRGNQREARNVGPHGRAPQQRQRLRCRRHRQPVEMAGGHPRPRQGRLRQDVR